MSRVSQEELYNDKDVVTQILKLKDTVNDYAGGIIENIDVSGNDLVIDWADGTSISLPLPDPVTGISSVTGSVTAGNLTITFYFTNGTTHSFTCPLNGMASETYVDAKDAQNVKLTGDQTIDGVKTFIGSANVPTVPVDLLGASAVNEAYVNDATPGVNNIVHKSGNEDISGVKVFTGLPAKKITNFDRSNPPVSYAYSTGILFIDNAGDELGRIMVGIYPDSRTTIELRVVNANGTFKRAIMLEGDP